MSQAVVLTKVSSNIMKGQKVGNPAVTRGWPVRFVGIPSGVSGSFLKFEASIDGFTKFYLRDSKGLVTVATTGVLAPESTLGKLQDTGTIMPFGEPDYTRGVVMFQAVSDRPQTKDVTIDFYYEASND